MAEYIELVERRSKTRDDCIPLLDRRDSDEPETVPFNDQDAVLTYTGTLNAITWREYLTENWTKITEGLNEVRVLIICGVHGDEEGNIGGDAKNVQTCKNQAVSLTFIHSTQNIYSNVLKFFVYF